MVDDSRLDGKLQELARELLARPVVPGFAIADAFATQGMDESGKRALFAAILLRPTPAPELNTLTAFRQVLTAKLKQVDTRAAAYPIVVQGAPEVIDASSVVPGGPEYFVMIKAELLARRERLAPRPLPMPRREEPSLRGPAAKKTKGAAVAVRASRKSSRRTAATQR